jgi:2-hydroxy-3-oxopropionate reductase
MRAYCSDILYLGDHLAAMGAKLIMNLAWYVNAAAMAEIYALFVKAGIPPGLIQGILRASCGNSWVAENDLQQILDGTFDPTFRLRLAVKDLQLIAELADMLGVPCDLAPITGGVPAGPWQPTARTRRS